MLDREVLDKNFRVLVLEVTKQVEYAMRILEEPTPDLIAKLNTRDDYIDYLRSLIDDACFSFLERRKELARPELDAIRGMAGGAMNLERIADHAVSIVRQSQHLSAITFLKQYAPRRFFDLILETLKAVPNAFRERDTAAALRIARTEVALDRLYEEQFQTILREMGTGSSVPDRVTALFIFHYLERIGDCLQNIGEAILLSRMGEKLKLNQYRQLRDSLAAVRPGPAPEQTDFATFWGTRSGLRIGKVSSPPGDVGAPAEVVFKEGDRGKMLKEKENLERWGRIAPGLAPRIFQYQESEAEAAMLLEYLTGQTLYEIALNADTTLIDQAVTCVLATVRNLWLDTMTPQPTRARFLHQLLGRLEDVYTVHPHFRGVTQQIGGLAIATFPELLKRNMDLDDELAAPFGILGHGDLNLDNVIYDAATDAVHFIDLHRSEELDYAHDISVFLVSAFRVPLFDAPRRRGLNRIIGFTYDFARAFAQERADSTFESRLALGLVRSFITSTRFEFQRSFAEKMFHRGLYLLERLDAHRGHQWADFALPRQVLVY